jgi:hypothetical protein
MNRPPSETEIFTNTTSDSLCGDECIAPGVVGRCVLSPGEMAGPLPHLLLQEGRAGHALQPLQVGQQHLGSGLAQAFYQSTKDARLHKMEA